MAIVSPLNLEFWLYSMFAGSGKIFLVIALFGIMGGAAYFRMPNIIAVMFVFLLSIFMMPYGITETLFMLIVMLIAIIAANIIYRKYAG